MLIASAVSAVLTPTEVPVNTPAVLSGTVDPVTAGMPVTMQMWRNGSWQVLQTSVTDVTGTYTFTYTPVTSGVKHYRVIVDAGRRPRGRHIGDGVADGRRTACAAGRLTSRHGTAPELMLRGRPRCAGV